MYAAAALGAVAIVAVPAASGLRPRPLKVHGKVSVLATPINTTDSKGKTKTTSVTVTGKVKAKGACLSGRKITFFEVTPSGSYPQSVTAVSNGKGSYTATLPFVSTGLTSKANGTAVTVSATATQVTRKDKATGTRSSASRPAASTISPLQSELRPAEGA
jgi:hypothetical protein